MIRNIKNKLRNVIKRERKASLLRIGIPQPPKPQNYFKKEIKELLKLNPNNIGTTTRMKFSEDSCRELENKTIKKISKWFKGVNIDGYINSGSTEGNIMALWIGREFLKKNGKPIIISHIESHYSLDKAARLLNLKIIKTKKNTWNKPLDKKLLKEITKNIKSPLIIVGTLGHTSTGIIDDVNSISDFIKEYKKPCFLHLDAAVGGFFLPFLNQENFSGFSNPLVKSLTFDYHKYGFLYYPSGIFLCKKNLQDCIGSNTDYVKIFDDTLIGSRSGILPAIIWANTEYLNKKGFKKRAMKIIDNKNNFIELLKEKNIEYIDTPNMPMLCIVLKKRLPKSTEVKFRIHSIKRKEGYTYTIFFYPEYLKSYSELLDLL